MPVNEVLRPRPVQICPVFSLYRRDQRILGIVSQALSITKELAEIHCGYFGAEEELCLYLSTHGHGVHIEQVPQHSIDGMVSAPLRSLA